MMRVVCFLLQVDSELFEQSLAQTAGPGAILAPRQVYFGQGNY